MYPVNAMKDSSKWVIIVPKMILRCLWMWPRSQENVFRKMFFWISLMLYIFVIAGQFLFVVNGASDVMEVVSSTIIMSANIQAMVKFMILNLNANKLRQLLFVFHHKFLPASTAGFHTERRLRRQSRLVFIAMCLSYFFSITCVVLLVVLPLTRGRMELPLTVWYGFDVSRNPEYVFVYSVQAIVLICAVQAIIGHDNLFIALCSNAIAQFILLEKAVLKVSKDEFARDRLKTCIRHHNILLRFCDGIEEVFSFSLLVQFVISTIGICTSAVVLSTRHLDFARMVNIFDFFLGSIMQLFLFCFYGSLVTHHSSSLALYIYSSGWEDLEDNQIKKMMAFMILRSQRAKRLSAKNFVYVDLVTFLGVMKGTMSVFALLCSFAEAVD
ncbi:Odorant receptor Or44 [Rhyzopertha dominica]|nr:Odorant receptor Or44 [Rhyzopertha dominica]